MSEISALYRGPLSTRIDNDIRILVPHSSFLAKNEHPQARRPPLRVRSLKENPLLCPVETMKAFLDRTSRVPSGPLFIASTGKPLSPNQVRYKLAQLIKKANPDSIPKSHDMRKVAFSLAFFSGMSFDEMSTFSGWKSHRIFLRHYLKEIGDLSRNCVTVGHSTNFDD